jgi:nicotinate-nucleotide adenylyltransferase
MAMAGRLGIFGGTFDPVHYGHLLLAETCREQVRLDRVLFVPASTPPHKQQHALTPPHARVEMLRLAIGGHERFEVSTMELERGGLSYTVETLEACQRQYPSSELFFLMGADSLAEFPTWREPSRICELAVPVVVRRAGAVEPDWRHLIPFTSAERLGQIQQAQVTMPVIELSSTDIRERVATGRSIRFRTPRAVEKYIETQRLYRSLSSG